MDLVKARIRLNDLKKSINHFFYGEYALPDLKQLPITEDDLHKDFGPPIEINELDAVLAHFGLSATVSDFYLGSSVTTYQLDVPPGFHLNDLVRNVDDIARDLNVSSIRINTSCHGKIGIEIENNRRVTVNFKHLALDIPTNYTIPIVLGEDTLGNPKYLDITDLPHLLIGGATGSGKSVFLHTLICSILATRTPEQIKLLMIDPKQVEFQPYINIPHLLEPIAYETHDANNLLNKAILLMDERFKLLTDARSRKLSEYREKTGKELPYIVFIIDEYADLMLLGTSKERKNVELKIARIAQKARAVGIHLILATQKPLTTVVTSVLKANLQSRIAFSVASGMDSRVILDQTGAEQLCGKGDMLFKNAIGHITRIQSPWMPDEVINHITGDI